MLSPAASLPPGFRFYPTDEELIVHYLRNQAAAAPCPVAVISEVDIYKHNPWDLPGKAMFGDKEWYFFSPRDRKYPNGIRPNRAAASGYWKATGIDKPIYDSNGNGNIGVKKALVFYKGRPPKGKKTNWIMHEYRLANPQTSNIYKPMKFRDSSMRLDDWVLCRIYKKSSHQGDEEDADDGMASEEHKSSSISEFDNNLSELPGHGLVQGSSFPHPSLNQFLMVSSSSNDNSVQQLKQEQSSYASVVVAEKSLKRRREHMNAEEEMNGVCTDHIITNMDGFQFQESWINQALSTQQLLLNSNYFGIN